MRIIVCPVYKDNDENRSEIWTNATIGQNAQRFIRLSALSGLESALSGLESNNDLYRLQSY